LRPSCLLAIVLLTGACSANNGSYEPSRSGRPAHADDSGTDQRFPELGGNPSIVSQAKVAMADGIAASEAQYGPTIEAKYELDDSGKLSLSIYPAGKPITLDAERNLFEEASGDPTATPWQPGLEVFHDQEHLTRSARDLTLLQLSRRSLGDTVAWAGQFGRVYWAIPTISEGRAGFGMYLLDDEGESFYAFVDGSGSGREGVQDLGTGPGDEASDARTPELGPDVSIVLNSRITLSAALEQAEAQHGPAIEAKFELDDSGKLSLSIYPTGKGVDVDAERNTFFELSGDPTAQPFAGDLAQFAVPDEEHLTRSSRDLTLIQTAGLTLRDAVSAVEQSVPGGFVYWAIPTIRDTRAGFGVYVLAPDRSIHYLFVS
jgi:hypothetical protein